MKSRSLSVVIAMLLVVASVPALAQKPIIQYAPFPSQGMVAPTSSICGFDILVTLQPGRPNHAKVIQFSNLTIGTGSAFFKLTNLITGKTINLNLSGPSIVTFSGTTPVTVGMGPGALLFPPAPLAVTSAAGLPPLPLVHGRTVLTLDEQFNVTAMTVNGNAEDLCRLLE